jgi:DUF4097 and DUF4098 domain-containing protein YvlB
MIRTLWLAQALALAALAQTSSGVAREGSFWVETVTGSVAAGAKVRVTADGAVGIQGERRGDIAYSLKRRVRAADEASARVLLGRIVVKAGRQGEWTAIEGIGPDALRAPADLRLRVPRQTRETAAESRGGAIEIADLDGSARAATAVGTIAVDRVAGGVTVRTGGGEVHLDKIGGSVECFTGGGSVTAGLLGGDATLGTGGGEIVVHEARGLVRARTLAGNIRIERADGGVQAAAIHGLVDVIRSGGPVTVETGTGSIKVGAASDVRCESGGGAIQLQSASGSLRAITTAGSILADLTGSLRLRSSALATAAGDITVLIPSNLRVTVEAINASSGSQRIVSDFPAIRPRLERGNMGSAAEGALNGGGPLLQLTASGGTIYLRRQK